MTNNFVLVGRNVSDLEINETEKGKESIMTLAIPRHYKNDEGIYETDFISCYLYGNIAKNTVEYCRKGDLVGARGFIQSENGNIILKVDKLSFLSSNKRDE